MGRKKIGDISGQRVGRLTIVKEVAPIISGGQERRAYVCRCDCGNEKVMRQDVIRCGDAVSCGCYMGESVAERKRKHGHATPRKVTPTYRSWRSMGSRCYNPKDTSYRYYGGRGITVCKRWQGEHGFENFLADMGERPKGRSLDRRDVNGNYEPDNCRWATPKEQGENKRRSIRGINK